MASNFTIKPATPSRPFVSPSRLIPGGRASLGGIPRKKPASATIDGRFWEWKDSNHPIKPAKPNTLALLGEILLPGHFFQVRRGLARQASADFGSVVFGVAATRQLSVLLQFAIRHDPAVLLGSFFLPTAGLGLLLTYAVLFTLLGYYEHLYDPETIQSQRQERLVLGKVALWSATAIGIVAAASFQPRPFSPAALVASAPINFLITMASRRRWWRLAVQPEPCGNGIRNVLIVGAGQLGRKLAAHIEQDHAHRRMVMGFLDETAPIRGDVQGRLEDLARIVRTGFVDEIILAAPLHREVACRIIHEARQDRIDVKIVPDLFGFEPDPIAFEKFGNIPVLTLREERLPLFGLFLKRGIDIAVAVVALVSAAPLLAIVALVIKLESPGPVLYRAQRAGLKGRRFLCYKFRTMKPGADKLKADSRARNERQGAFFKIQNDPRITRAGQLLRRYSLDELPQLWNVLKGEMSLVGPRPHPLDDFERYDVNDLQRLEVPPGITGLWQVTARRDPSFERSLALDVEYIENWTLWRDFQILCKTVSVVLHGSGA